MAHPRPHNRTGGVLTIFVTIKCGYSFPHISVSYETLNPHCSRPPSQIHRVTFREPLMGCRIQLLHGSLILCHVYSLALLSWAWSSPMYFAASLSPLPCNSPEKRIHLVCQSCFHRSRACQPVPDELLSLSSLAPLGDMLLHRQDLEFDRQHRIRNCLPYLTELDHGWLDG